MTVVIVVTVVTVVRVVIFFSMWDFRDSCYSSEGRNRIDNRVSGDSSKSS